MSYLRIGIVGDCGVGKSALSMKIRSIGSMSETDLSLQHESHGYSPTIGCDIHIIECYCAAKNATLMVEIFDMGGNPRFEKCRNVYIDGCHGFIFVWDCSLEGTYHSLQKWLQEISAAIEKASTTVSENAQRNSMDEDIENLVSSGQGSDLTDNKPSIPILIVGNKIDSVSAATQQELRQACPQQLFVSCISGDWDFQPLLEFFCEVYTLHYGETLGMEEEEEDEEEQEQEDGDGGMESPTLTEQSVSQAWSPTSPLPFPSFVSRKNSASQQHDGDNSSSRSVRQPDLSSPAFQMPAAPCQESTEDVLEWPIASATKGAFTLLRHRISKW